MSLALAYKLQQGQLQGSNQVYIEQLQLGQRTNSDKATSLPVELAIALLEDDKGVIDLGLEVSGDVNDPDFNVAGLVFKALGNAIKKIITSPFSLLGSLIGSDETLNQLTFDGGSSQLQEQQNSKLASLVEGLAKRPQLKMAIIGSVDPVLDVPVLKRQHLAEELNQQAKLELPIEQINLSKVLEEPALRRALELLSQQRLEESLRQEQRKQISAKLREQQQLSPENVNLELYSLWYQLLVEQIEITDGELEALAEQRAIAVKDALTEQHGLALERAFVERKALSQQSGKAEVSLSILTQ
jgi:outer membrane protein OmpA-like peptidoglycan-associated protein